MQYTLETRLKIYKFMLFMYRLVYFLNSFFFISKRKFGVQQGFCYFLEKHGLEGNIKEYPELIEQRPLAKNLNSYWWACGKLRPRIKALKKAIKLCKDEFRKNNY